MIRNKYISQKKENLRSIPTFTVNSNGEKQPVAVYLSFFYKCRKAGKLRVEFENVDKTGFESFNSFLVEEDLSETDSYKQYTCNGLWNGTGDFKLSFTGEICLYMLVLSTDKVESLAYKYRTLLEQSEKLVKIAAQNFDKDGRVLEESEIITTAKYNELTSKRFNDDGSLKNVAGLVTTTDWDAWQTTYTTDIGGLKTLLDQKMEVTAFAGMFASAVDNDHNIVKQADIAAFVTKDKDGKLESGVHIGADQINLEGLVTANKGFKILEDGSMEAVGGKFSGDINLYDKNNDGLKVFDENDIVRVNIQSDSIGDIAQMANDTYTFISASSTSSTKSFNNTATTPSIGTLQAGKTIEIDNVSIFTYGSDNDKDYPSTPSAQLKIEILNGSTVVATKNVPIVNKSFSMYSTSTGFRHTIKENGTYYVRYTISGISSTPSSSTINLLVNARIQTSDVVQTIIGDDGLYCHPGANKILWLNENELQFRFGFGGLRLTMPSSQSMAARLSTIAGVYGESPSYKPIWLPFHNITPMFSPSFGTTTETVVNTGSTGKYVYKIDPFNNNGICYIEFPAMDKNGNEQESWILLPSSTQTYKDKTIQLPRGYTITIINGTRKNVFVTGNVSDYHGCKIIDANRNENYSCSLNGTQCRDTYIYVGSYFDGSIKGNVDFWIAMHDTQ